METLHKFLYSCVSTIRNLKLLPSTPIPPLSFLCPCVLIRLSGSSSSLFVSTSIFHLNISAEVFLNFVWKICFSKYKIFRPWAVFYSFFMHPVWRIKTPTSAPASPPFWRGKAKSSKSCCVMTFVQLFSGFKSSFWTHHSCLNFVSFYTHTHAHTKTFH